MAEGKSDWEIAVILKVSEHLVDKIARQIRAKLNATTARGPSRLRSDMTLSDRSSTDTRTCSLALPFV
ncbi:hypothetical protein [Nitrobacter sp. TKz-YC01]|uniref:hypothetical protein n=1 Tax=Nitrobacter sp. TKz-YC01 TaxID=3398703 RepID=UPI003A102250